MRAREYEAKIESLTDSQRQLKKLYDNNGRADIAADTALLIINSLINAEKAAFKAYKKTNAYMEEGRYSDDD